MFSKHEVFAYCEAALIGFHSLPSDFRTMPDHDRERLATAWYEELMLSHARRDERAVQLLRDFPQLWRPAAPQTPTPTVATEQASPRGVLLRHFDFPAPPPILRGRGIVTSAGGPRYFACAYVLFKLLRHVGCPLPIECWYLGEDERDESFERLCSPLGVTFVDAIARGYKLIDETGIGFDEGPGVWSPYKPGAINGYGVKAFAILHSAFAESLWLDADNTPARDPGYLFDDATYRECGAILWPDNPLRRVPVKTWRAFGLEPIDEREVEAGQLLVDKRKCWDAINLAWLYNLNRAETYKYHWGDKETFHLAWRVLGQDYAMPATNMRWGERTPGDKDVAFIQHDLVGEPLFWHRVVDSKYSIDGPNRHFDYPHHAEAIQALAEYRDHRKLRIEAQPRPLRIAQVCPTVGTACGVGNFAASFSRAISGQASVTNHRTLADVGSADLVLIQHEHGIYHADQLTADLKRSPAQKLLFAHSPGVEKFAPYVNAFGCMVEGLLTTSLPLFVMPHPANIADLDHQEAKRQLGMDRFARVVGTCGFCRPERELDRIVDGLLPLAERENWLVYLVTPPHTLTAQEPEHQQLRAKLQAIRSPHLRLDLDFLPAEEQARRLRAFDVGWVWTTVQSSRYASGVASDLYGSGARLVAQAKEQHGAVLGRENVVAVDSSDPKDLVAAIVREAKGDVRRHDPSPLSWPVAAERFLTFLREHFR